MKRAGLRRPLVFGKTLAAVGILLIAGWRYYDRTIAVVLPQLSLPSDFRPYNEAAHLVVHGASPYLAHGYIYPPGLAFLLTPLEPLDYLTARRVWFALSQLFLLASAILVWRFAGRDLAAACWIAAVWAGGGAATEALALGQIAPLLTLLTVLAIVCRGRVQAASVGVGFALKLFPGVLGIVILLRRERPAIRWMCGSALALIALPWAVVALFLKGPLAAAGSLTGTPATLSWSLPSVVLRLLDPPRRGYPLPDGWQIGNDLEHFHLSVGLSIVSIGVCLLTLGAGVWTLARVARGRWTDSLTPWAMAALVPLTLAASPIGWTHYQVIQYPGVAILLIHLWRRQRWAELALAMVLAGLLYPLPVRILSAYYDRYHAWTAASPPTLYLWTSVTPLASLGLFALFLRRAADAGRAPTTPLR